MDDDRNALTSESLASIPHHQPTPTSTPTAHTNSSTDPIHRLKVRAKAKVKAKAKAPPPPPPAKKATRAAGHQATAATLVLGFYALQEEAGWPVASEQFLTSEPVNTGLMVLMSVILGTLLGKK